MMHGSMNVMLYDCMILKNELGRMWKEGAVAFFEVFSIHLCGVTEQNYVIHCQDCWCSDIVFTTQARRADIWFKKGR
jgi:hypothetical protein